MFGLLMAAFLVFALLGVPVFFAMGLAALVFVLFTAGAVVSTVKDSAVLWPVFPAPSDWKARVVWVPSARASASGTDVDQMPEPSTAMPG